MSCDLDLLITCVTLRKSLFCITHHLPDIVLSALYILANFLLSQQPCKTYSVPNAILQLRKLRYREVKQLAQGTSLGGIARMSPWLGWFQDPNF